ncbi:hypothetical protein B0H17DRAFT_925085 [Mycena rosella]|uniref:Uncharacterized protein n=1 Tax=Mycena rosella TaxID=1033263 RepID=A0AAD7GLM9_MYCRO|nr:hypothetical protein B0H17DRAFT_925085 [Mycena rosella]
MAPGSSSASSSASGSASPEPEARPSKKGGKSKAAEHAKSKAPARARNEGDDPHWAYTPPPKTKRLEASADVGDFDWDALSADPDLELWLVRIPEGVKPKYLETAQLELPAAARKAGAPSAKLGMLQRKHVAYDIWSLGADAADAADLAIGGEEIKGLACLLPRKSRKGKLYAAPTPIARTIVMAAQAVKPTPDPTITGSPTARPVYKNPPRERHPVELLTHSFMPYGSTVGEGEGERADTPAAMEVDGGEVLVPETPAKQKKEKGESKKSKGKKRKGEGEGGESPKKLKKAKTTS